MATKRPLVWGDDTQSLREIRDGETLVGIPGAGGGNGGGSGVTADVQAVMAGGVALKDGEVGAGDAVFLRVDDAGLLRCARASAGPDGRAADALAAQIVGDRVWFCQHGMVAGYAGLPPGGGVFLAVDAGGVTATPPWEPGQSVQRLGTALTESVILFERGVSRPILEE